MVAKSNQILGLIKRPVVYKNTDVIKKLTTSLVRPHLEYANTVASKIHQDVEAIGKFRQGLRNCLAL